jgi:hypothetical protein
VAGTCQLNSPHVRAHRPQNGGSLAERLHLVFADQAHELAGGAGQLSGILGLAGESWDADFRIR